MDKNNLINELKETLSEITYIDIDEIDENASLLGDISVSSMELLQLVSSLEKKHNIKIQEKELRTFVSINDIANYILEKIKHD